MNNIASFARQAQTHLQTIAGADSANFKRSHVYELMAAALGFGTHAALKAHGLLCPLPSQPLLALYGTLDPELCAARAEVLGIARKRSGPLAKALCADMAAQALGQHDALLLLADRYGDDRFFDLQAPQVRANPLWIADLAQRVGRYECTPAWLTVAAERGDMWAMRELLESWHADDPLQVWTWFHYAKLLGKDLTQGDYRAIHEDGSRYDDDVGGPMFVDGVDGVELPPVDEPMRQEAQRAAQSLFDRMKAD